MAYEKIEFYAPSSDGIHRLSGVVFLPKGERKGFFQVVHGMTEHIARYEKFMTDMAEAGFVCFGHDHVGHGNTAKDDSELGFIAHENGWKVLVDDVKAFSDAVFAEFGKGDLPYLLMGHSMGSFVVRLAAKDVMPNKLIIMGTGGSNPAADAGLAVIAAIKKIKGERHISKLVDNLAFGSYNKRFPEVSDSDPSPWLTNDKSEREKYYADKFCTFKFTVSAMGDLIRLTKYSNAKSWYENFPTSLPTLLVSGENDPVGGYGKGVREVADKLTACGIPTTLTLYPNARHEILNDFTYEQLKGDILGFVNT